MVLFTIAFSFSWGPITWLYLPEIMTEKAMSLGAMANQSTLVLISIVTRPLIVAIDGWLFVIFGIWCLIAMVFTWIFVKETKGLSEA